MRSPGYLFALLLFTAGFTVQAQEDILTPQAIAESLTKNMEGNLQLEGDQLQKVGEINQEYAQALADLRRQDSEGQKGASAKKLLADYDDAMKAVLSADQYQQFQSIKAEQAQQLRKAGLERSTARLAEELGLSDEQIAGVNAINATYAPRIQAVRDSGEPGRNKMRQLQAINGERNEELKAVLTAEQFAKYQELQAEKREELRERRMEKRN